VIARSSDVAAEIISSTAADHREAVTALGSLASVNLGSMQDVVILIGNRRGTSAMKLARSMVEVAITALYLERNPAQINIFLAFPHVFSWNYLQKSERDNPGGVPPQLRAQAEIEYNRVKLVTGHGSLLQAVSSLYNLSKLVPAELGRKLEAQSKEGNDVRKRYVEKRDRDRSGRSTAK